ncbi:MAG TPA: hypothetical protein PLN33_00715 [Hyphomonadaceae bacterium]|nr:hypothetical protein [Hyphomonadaceae bacterium]
MLGGYNLQLVNIRMDKAEVIEAEILASPVQRICKMFGLKDRGLKASCGLLQICHGQIALTVASVVY